MEDVLKEVSKKEEKFYIVSENVLPEIIKKVITAKNLLENGKIKTVQEATELVGLSRSAYYKYKDYIFPFYDKMKGKTITFTIDLYDNTGHLSKVLDIIAKSQANVLTIHQTLPIHNIASVAICIETGGMDLTIGISKLFEQITELEGVKNLNIIAQE